LLKCIKNKNEIRRIFDFGSTVNSSDKKVKAIYHLSTQENPPEIKYAVAISSKSGNSVWRNRFKRLIREAINAETSTINELTSDLEEHVEIIFLPAVISQKNSKKIFFKDIQPAVLDILKKIKAQRALSKRT
jgi:ribonuclease P protein component